MKKVATGQSFIRKEVTFYKIHTLIICNCKDLLTLEEELFHELFVNKGTNRP